MKSAAAKTSRGVAAALAGNWDTAQAHGISRFGDLARAVSCARRAPKQAVVLLDGDNGIALVAPIRACRELAALGYEIRF